jgi:4'-phosphopantetheinyl transferase EntD
MAPDEPQHWACRYAEGLPLPAAWALLHPGERQDLAGVRHPRRLAAAVHARLLLRLTGGFRLVTAAEVVASAGRASPGPAVRYRDPPDDRCPVHSGAFVSIAHDATYCYVARDRRPVGCDVEMIAAHTPAFRATHFSGAELAQLEEAAATGRLPWAVTLGWTLKEAYFKLACARARRSAPAFVPAAVPVAWDRLPFPPMGPAPVAFACRCGPAGEWCEATVHLLGRHVFTLLRTKGGSHAPC